jgi:hypothetical protein
VRYDHLVAADTAIGEFHGAATFLGLPFAPESDAEWFRSIVRLRPGAPSDDDHAYPRRVAALWAELCRRHARQPQTAAGIRT